jgi:hypothetical protein
MESEGSGRWVDDARKSSEADTRLNINTSVDEAPKSSWKEIERNMTDKTLLEIQMNSTSDEAPQQNQYSDTIQPPPVDEGPTTYYYLNGAVLSHPISPGFDNTAAVKPPYNGPPAIVSSTFG